MFVEVTRGFGMSRFVLVAVLVAVAALRASAGDGVPSLTGVIDRHLDAKLRAANVPAAPPADDAEFFRRVNLALAGRIPAASEVREFLADPSAGKRTAAIDKLLNSAAYATHQTTLWRGWLIPEASADPQVAGTAPGFEAWLRPRLAANLPFDKLVRELLTTPLDGRQPAMRMGTDDTTTPIAFYTAKEGKPENLAAATSRLFLGVQLECAQCHDHPFAKWSREQFWGLTAFFGGVSNANGALRELGTRREMTIPNTDRTVPATFLDDQQPAWRYKSSPRVTLADWVVAKNNPFFAKATVNRLWGQLFGVGLVDPVDDFNDQNVPSHPELLDDLAAAFVASGFDLRATTRALLLTEAFQRTSRVTEPGQRDPRLFARFAVQGLTPEQLYDSLSVALGVPLEGPGAAYLAGNGSPKSQFVAVFRRNGKPTEAQTTILQALELMNGPLTGAAATVNGGGTLTGVQELPGLTDAERVEAIYLAVLSRPPTPEELARLAKAGAVKPERLADVLWVLLNGIEFRTLH